MSKLSIKARIEAMEKQCIGLATHDGEYSYETYEKAWSDLLSNASLVRLLPDWLITCRYGSYYWSFIKEKGSTYNERRKFLRSEFSILLDRIGRVGIDPTSLSLQELLAVCTSNSVQEAWQKCFERRIDDPEGAITSARTLLESTCKYILERLGEEPDNSGDLPRLYKQAAKLMQLSPSQHDEQIFKQILSGCGTVVDGLSSLRNAFGDSHGKGTIKIKPSKRHAELAVNLAGSLSSFLIATYEENSK